MRLNQPAEVILQLFGNIFDCYDIIGMSSSKAEKSTSDMV